LELKVHSIFKVQSKCERSVDIMSKARTVTTKNSKLDSILNESNLPYFLMAVSHLMDVGYRHMTEENVKETIEEINKKDDTGAIMTNDFMVFMVETAYKISQAANPLELAKFASKHIS
jgi:hypothetical protein